MYKLQSHPSQPAHPPFHSDQRLSRDHQTNHSRPPSVKLAWRDLPVRVALNNLLVNSLTSRLRHSPVTSLGPGRSASHGLWCHGTGAGKADVRTYNQLHQLAVGVDRRQRGQLDTQRSSTHCSRSPGHGGLNHVMRAGRPAASGDQGMKAIQNKSNTTPSSSSYYACFQPTSAYRENPACPAHLTWVKRAGIFQLVDKYTPGRQTLHGDSGVAPHCSAVEYETVTLHSGSVSSHASPEPSRKQSQQAVLKVSWKAPRLTPSKAADRGSADSRSSDSRALTRGTESQGEGKVVPRSASDRLSHTTSARTASSRRRFHPHPHRHSRRHHVPCVGVRWKLPSGRRRPPLDLTSSTTHPLSCTSSTSPSSSVCSSPSSTHSLPSPSAPPPPSDQRRVSSGPSRPPLKPSLTSQRPQARTVRYQPQVQQSSAGRRLHSNPLGLSTERRPSSTKAHHYHHVSSRTRRVPGRRQVPEVPAMEELMESRCQQWHPGMK